LEEEKEKRDGKQSIRNKGKEINEANP